MRYGATIRYPGGANPMDMAVDVFVGQHSRAATTSNAKTGANRQREMEWWFDTREEAEVVRHRLEEFRDMVATMKIGGLTAYETREMIHFAAEAIEPAGAMVQEAATCRGPAVPRAGALASKANIIDGAGEKHPLPWTAVTRGGPTTLLDGNHQEIAVMHEAAAQLIVMAVEFYAETFGTNTGEDEE